MCTIYVLILLSALWGGNNCCPCFTVMELGLRTVRSYAVTQLILVTLRSEGPGRAGVVVQLSHNSHLRSPVFHGPPLPTGPHDICRKAYGPGTGEWRTYSPSSPLRYQPWWFCHSLRRNEGVVSFFISLFPSLGSEVPVVSPRPRVLNSAPNYMEWFPFLSFFF